MIHENKTNGVVLIHPINDVKDKKVFLLIDSSLFEECF